MTPLASPPSSPRYEEARASVHGTGRSELLQMHLEAVLARQLFERGEFEACVPHVRWPANTDRLQTLDGSFSAVSNPILQANICFAVVVKIYNICAFLHSCSGLLCQFAATRPTVEIRHRAVESWQLSFQIRVAAFSGQPRFHHAGDRVLGPVSSAAWPDAPGPAQSFSC